MLIECGVLNDEQCFFSGSENRSEEIENDNQADIAYIERLTAPPCPVRATPEQIVELRKQGYNV